MDFYKDDNLSIYTGLIETSLSMILSTLDMYANDSKCASEKNILNNIEKYRSIILKLSTLCFIKGITIYNTINIEFSNFTSNEKLLYDLYKTNINYQFDDDSIILDDKYMDLFSNISFIIYIHLSYAIGKAKNEDVGNTKKLMNKMSY